MTKIEEKLYSTAGLFKTRNSGFLPNPSSYLAIRHNIIQINFLLQRISSVCWHKPLDPVMSKSEVIVSFHLIWMGPNFSLSYGGPRGTGSENKNITNNYPVYFLLILSVRDNKYNY